MNGKAAEIACSRAYYLIFIHVSVSADWSPEHKLLFLCCRLAWDGIHRGLGVSKHQLLNMQEFCKLNCW